MNTAKVMNNMVIQALCEFGCIRLLIKRLSKVTWESSRWWQIIMDCGRWLNCVTVWIGVVCVSLV